MTIRTRLAILVTLVNAATLLVLAVILITSVQAYLTDQVDDMVRGAAARPGPRRGPPPPTRDMNLSGRPIAEFEYLANGTQVASLVSGVAEAPDAPPVLPPIPSTELNRLTGRMFTAPAQDGSEHYRVFITRGPRGEYQITAGVLRQVEATVFLVQRVLAVAGAAALAVAAFASWQVISRGLRPVAGMIDAAAAIGAGDLTRRAPNDDPSSELGRLGAALNQMMDRIEEAVQERAAGEQRLRQFAADAAHELRTPLTSLRGYAELFRQGALPDEESMAHAMRRIEAESARMARLVDDLLLLARLDQQRGLELERVDVTALVRDAVSDFAAVDPGRPLHQALDSGAVVLGDRVRLRQIVDNLLTNARVHTPPGAPVQVAVRRDAEAIEITVADEGPGIAAADQPHVFERFWRADPSRVRRTGGTGLGLAIVASLVQAHGGVIRLASEPGHGSAFTVRLPLAGV